MSWRPAFRPCPRAERFSDERPGATNDPLARLAIVPHGETLVRIAILGCLVLLLARSAHAGDETRSATGYRNGRPIKIELVMIDWAEVEVKTARAFRAMQAAALADGVELMIRSGFRTHERQTWLYRAWRAGWGNRAAKPGFSNHESGRALDLVIHDPATFAWLERHAKKFGFRRTVKKEPWHWELVGRPRSAARTKPR